MELVIASHPRLSARMHDLESLSLTGDTGSVNTLAVEAEQIRVWEILAKFAPRDHFNFDETGLFAFVPPD